MSGEPPGHALGITVPAAFRDARTAADRVPIGAPHPAGENGGPFNLAGGHFLSLVGARLGSISVLDSRFTGRGIVTPRREAPRLPQADSCFQEAGRIGAVL